MHNPGSQNTPEPSEKQIANSSDHLSGKSSEQNVLDRFLTDISSIKHIPELTKGQANPERQTLLEAIFNATVVQTLSVTAREFRLLGANFINRSVFMGLSKEFGQSPYMTLFKSETKSSIHDQQMEQLARDKAIKLQKDDERKDKSLKELKQQDIDRSKDKAKKESVNVKDKEPDIDSDSKPKPDKPEKKSTQDNQSDDQKDEYNINEIIRKATELELGTLSSIEYQNMAYSKMERTPTHDLGSSTRTSNNIDLSTDRLYEIIQKFSQGKILVLGDLLIDELLEGRAERVSREAPVIILEHVDTILILGGAANTAHNVTALGGHCHALGVCGNDEYAKKLANLFNQYGITHDLVVDSDRPTTVKTRIYSKTHASMQQLLRLDRISHEIIDSNIEKQLIDKLEAIAGQYPVLVLSDYRAGVFTDQVIHACRKITAAHELTLIVDAQDNFERFQNVSLLTPNQPDTEKAVGYQINTHSDLLRAGEDMLLLTGAQSVLITQGKKGMTLFKRGADPFSLPAFNRSEVFDVSGAGDTVVATIGLALSIGASLPEAVALGNIAAGIVVKKPGTAVTNQKEMLVALKSINFKDQ